MTADDRPDIIFLMTDQQRWDALGVQNPLVKTPNLDRLIQTGIRFPQATCQAPMCVPSRHSLMTGMYPSQNGVRSNESATPGDAAIAAPVLAEAMREAGYLTAGFGKTHWGRTPETPSTRGFDVRVVGTQDLGLEVGAVGWQEEEDPEGRAAYLEMTREYGPGEEEPVGYLGATSTIPTRNHPDGWIAERALEWLEGPDLDTDKPLFFYLSFVKPHAGHNPAAEFEALYDLDEIPDLEVPPWDESRYDHIRVRDENSPFLGARSQRWREAWRTLTPRERRLATLRYWANCSWLDSLFGEALDRLAARGRLDNALIVFASDHGELLGERNFQFSKYCLYDSSVRVPLVLSGAAIAPHLRGTVDERPAALVDVYPTIAHAAGFDIHPGAAGASLLERAARSGSFAEMHEPVPAWMWRTARYKLIVFVDPNTAGAQGELYDLQADPREWHNLYDDPAHLAVRADLMAELIAHIATSFAAAPTHGALGAPPVLQEPTAPAGHQNDSETRHE
ncbi:sulfatase family protein [Microbacterium aquimaris]|uniref:Sulfatase-like hydrolase/transferase n=1 Tax=Microbacterium aquimaris TaxID=459816 RepID=A0ABU5N480_9MICO|nr:sulfatase-like hydrolase/transferase [Microbacterium aquimaris]MDZ8160840.1 sulfatase-like hydrolase/transferase [Microbacterium aquimaris]